MFWLTTSKPEFERLRVSENHHLQRTQYSILKQCSVGQKITFKTPTKENKKAVDKIS